MGSTLFFPANDGADGRELWKSDGTEAGTVLVKDISSGADGSYPVRAHRRRVHTLLRGQRDDERQELWKSDGTEAGTVLVRDVFPGDGGSDPELLTTIGSTLGFVASDSSNGREVWTSDGTSAGTVLVRDVYPGAGGSDPHLLTAVGSTLFFSADDDTHGVELWKTTLFVEAAPPGTPTGMGQFTGDGTTPVGVGKGLKKPVVLKAVAIDADVGDTVKLEFEVKPVGTAFDGSTGVYPTALMTSGFTGSVSVNLPRGSYHWQARTVDRGGNQSAWVSFGGNAETSADFKIRGK